MEGIYGPAWLGLVGLVQALEWDGTAGSWAHLSRCHLSLARGWPVGLIGARFPSFCLSLIRVLDIHWRSGWCLSQVSIAQVEGAIRRRGAGYLGLQPGACWLPSDPRRRRQRRPAHSAPSGKIDIKMAKKTTTAGKLAEGRRHASCKTHRFPELYPSITSQGSF